MDVSTAAGADQAAAPPTASPVRGLRAPRGRLRLLLADPFALTAVVVLVLVALAALAGPPLMGDLAVRQELRAANQPPFTLEHGWAYVLGSDSLGRSLLARLVVASRTTLGVALPAVAVSMLVGTAWGLDAGYRRGWRETLAMRVADVILSFPVLLTAVVVLYLLEPRLANLVGVLAVTRIPIYLRTARAEATEVRSRLFVDAARTFGARDSAIIARHVAPVVVPTILTVATLELCFVILTESSLSFLGIGVQPPDVSWGLMVAQGRQYLQTAWWVAIMPGVAIILTTTAATVLAAWARTVLDPAQRSRLQARRRGRGRTARSRQAAGATGQPAVQAPEGPDAADGPSPGDGPRRTEEAP